MKDYITKNDLTAYATKQDVQEMFDRSFDKGANSLVERMAKIIDASATRVIKAVTDDLGEVANDIMQHVNERFNKVEADIAELKTDVNELKTNVAVLKTDVAELKTDVADLKTDVSELKTDVVELKGTNQQFLQRLEDNDADDLVRDSKIARLEHWHKAKLKPKAA